MRLSAESRAPGRDGSIWTNEGKLRQAEVVRDPFK